MSRSSALVAEYSLQHKRKWSVASISRSHLSIGSTISLKPCLNLCSFKWLKFNLRRVSSLRSLVSCIAKTEFSFALIKLRIISINFQEWHFDTQKNCQLPLNFRRKINHAIVLIRNKTAFYYLFLPTFFVFHYYWETKIICY